ncbi:hypothetical protein ACJZ2D_000359 [Fusarium nematophilum]
MSLRKTSCTACVSAKRRCDRGVPACRRCTHKSLPCEYPYSLITQPIATTLVPQDGHGAPSWAPPGLQGAESCAWVMGSIDDAQLLDSGIPNEGGLVSLPWESSWVVPNAQEASDPPLLEQMHVSEADMWNDTLASLFEPSLDENTSSGSRCEEGRPCGTSRHHRKRRHRRSQQAGQEPQPLPSIARALSINEIWPRGRDVKTWNFCARELLSFVRTFASTATNPFILTPAPQDNSIPHSKLHSSLQKALGVCSAYCTLSDANPAVFGHLLEDEVQHLVESSKSEAMRAYPNISDIHGVGIDVAIFAFREDLARLQTMSLYQIMGLFSNDVGRQRLAKQHEALLASWTRELLLRIQMLELLSKAVPSSPPCSTTTEGPLVNDEDQGREQLSDGGVLHLSWNQRPLQREEVESAYRTVLVSYLARCIYSALSDQTCALLAELGSLPVFLPQQWQKQGCEASQQESWTQIRQTAEVRGFLNKETQTIPYHNFTDLWSQERSVLGLEDCDRFILLLVIACMGVDVIRSDA